jgi:hypothetical protein
MDAYNRQQAGDPTVGWMGPRRKSSSAFQALFSGSFESINSKQLNVKR